MTLVTDCAPASRVATIKTAQDATDISTCETFNGNVVVAADGPEELAFDGIKTITGNLDIENVAKLRSLTSKTLESVNSLTLMNLPLLEELDIPTLKSFSLQWAGLPKLTECKIATGGLEGEIQEITIYNTSLKSLDWLTWPVGGALNITANSNLEEFKIPYGTINVGNAITLASNQALKSVDVSAVGGIYGGLAITKNDINTLSFPKLLAIGGFVQLSGDYTNISMPALNQVNGALGVESTADIGGFCNSLQEKRLAGHYDCTSNAQRSANPSTSGTTPSPSPSPTASQAPTDTGGSGSGGGGGGISSSAAIAGLVVGIIICLFVALLVYFYMRRRARKAVQEISPKDPEADSVELADSMSRMSIPSNRTTLRELESPVMTLELASGRMRQELPAGALPVEMESPALHSELDGGWESGSVRTAGSPTGSTAPLVRHELPG
jgi:hypothetical protein